MPSCCAEEKTSKVTIDFQQLDDFISYSQKRFALRLLAGCFGDCREDPAIPSRAVGLSLLLGEVVKVPSLLQLEEETKGIVTDRVLIADPSLPLG